MTIVPPRRRARDLHRRAKAQGQLLLCCAQVGIARLRRPARLPAFSRLRLSTHFGRRPFERPTLTAPSLLRGEPIRSGPRHRRRRAAPARGRPRARPRSTISWISAGNLSNRSAFATVLRSIPTRSAISCWERPRLVRNLLEGARPPRAASGRAAAGFRPAPARAGCSSSRRSRITAGTVAEPGQSGGAPAPLAGDEQVAIRASLRSPRAAAVHRAT